MIPTVFAHEGESHPTEPEIETVHFGSTATSVTYVVLVLIVLVGIFLLLYQYRKRNK